MRIVGVAKLIEQLLLHIIGYYTLVRNSRPEIFVTVDINHIRRTFYAHSSVHLFHVALKGLCLWVIDAEACCRLYP